MRNALGLTPAAPIARLNGSVRFRLFVRSACLLTTLRSVHVRYGSHWRPAGRTLPADLLPLLPDICEGFVVRLSCEDKDPIGEGHRPTASLGPTARLHTSPGRRPGYLSGKALRAESPASCGEPRQSLRASTFGQPLPASRAPHASPLPLQYLITRDKNLWHATDFAAPNNSAGGASSSIFPAATKAT